MCKKSLSVILLVCIFPTITNSCIEIRFERTLESEEVTGNETAAIGSAGEVGTSDSPFTGIWQGVDPYDGSIITLNLVQSGEELQGTFEDTFTKSVRPPGFSGPASGMAFSATSGEMIFQVSRWDGVFRQLDVRLILSDENNTMTLIFLKEGTPDPTEESVQLQRQ